MGNCLHSTKSEPNLVELSEIELSLDVAISEIGHNIDRFEDVSNYVHKGIEFCERYEEFWKKRCAIENTYAKSLRKLIESFEPKKKDLEENDSTHLKCFAKMLNELRDSAGQHELVAENVKEKVIDKMTVLVKILKEERRKCIEDKEKCFTEHLTSDEQLEKCKQKYERAFKEVEKAEELLNKVENDDSASKNDIKKQKNVCDQKKRVFDVLEAEYGKQLCEANRTKNVYYNEQLPNVFDMLQNIEKKRIDNFKELVCECTNIEIEVLPRIKQCLKEIETSAMQISSDQDIEVAVRLYKTGYQVPPDHVFEYLPDKPVQNNPNKFDSNASQLNGSINSNGSNGLNSNSSATLSGHATTTSTSNLNSRQKKYRTLNRIKGLFTVQTANKAENGLYDLPPQQLKNELVKKMNQIQLELEKTQKEREGLLKLKDIYSRNQKFGDSQSAESALKSNEEKINNLNLQMRKYQEIYNQVELNGAYNNSHGNGNGNYSNNQYQNNHHHHQQQQQQYSSNGDGNTSSASSSASGSGGTLPRDLNKAQIQQHIYQSPSQLSVDSNSQQNSLPGTPISHHNFANGNMNGTPKANNNHNNNNNTAAYAVSPVSSNTNGNGSKLITKMAPLVNNNESFDDEEEEDGCYESPSAALRHQQQQEQQKNGNYHQTTITTVHAGSNGSDSSSNHKTTTTAAQMTSNTVGFIYADTQYDHVDTNVYDQTNLDGQYDEQEDHIIGTALVMYSFAGTVQNAMSIQENESLNVLERDSGDGWTLVKRLNGEKGYVPTDYIQIVYY